MLLSVVVPCYNEESVLPTTHRRLVEALEGGLDTDSFELVYVNDGSKDGTLALLRQLQRADGRVRVVSFSRNFGHQLAVSAGLEHAAGDAVVAIDADLQDPPEVIPQLVERWREGYDVAYAVRSIRVGEPRWRLWAINTFYRLINRLSDPPIPLDTGDFRLLDRKVVNVLLSMPERDRFVRGMVTWIGFRQVSVPYQRAPRFAGESKYPILKLLKLALDGVTSFSVVPLKLATTMGFGSIGIALLGSAYAIYVRLFTDHHPTGWASLFVAVLFMGGVQLVSLGIIGEYIGRIYGEVKRRPLYLVAERLGFPGEVDAHAAKPANARVPVAAPALAGPGGWPASAPADARVAMR